VWTEKKENMIGQYFKVRYDLYVKVRLLAASRRGTGEAATAQDIYTQAISEYIERNAVRFDPKERNA
jgi:hypothetical protein